MALLVVLKICANVMATPIHNSTDYIWVTMYITGMCGGHHTILGFSKVQKQLRSQFFQVFDLKVPIHVSTSLPRVLSLIRRSCS